MGRSAELRELLARQAVTFAWTRDSSSDADGVSFTFKNISVT